jgi:hypothetical protein
MLLDLQESVKDKSAFNTIDDYHKICFFFLRLLETSKPTRIISPSHSNYICFQYGKRYNNRFTRPINTDLFIENSKVFEKSFNNFIEFLEDLKIEKASIINNIKWKEYIASKEINKIVYTLQQSIGCIGDSFDSPNQSRRRVGQLFENSVKLIIRKLGINCESRVVKIPIPGHEDHTMRYDLDLVFSRNAAVIASETRFIHPSEIVGSVKTTSKDRLDKIFLDKYFLSKFIGRQIPVVAIFLHDVQSVRRFNRGKSIFRIGSTFKTNHFLGYTIALTRLDGVYYVDLNPRMEANEELKKEIENFQNFLISDIWDLLEQVNG